MATITLDKLPELKDPEYTDKLNILVMRDVYGSDVAYRTDLANLSTFYFPSTQVKDLIDSLENLRTEIEKKVSTLQGSTYMLGQNYVTKLYADRYRSVVMTEERLERLLESFITVDRLSVYMEESELHANQIAAEIINYMANAAATSKFGAANQSSLETVSDAIESISIPESTG